MPSRTGQTKVVRHREIAPSRATAVPASISNVPSWTPLSPRLTQNMNTLILLARQIESLKHGLEINLFPTPAEYHKALTRMDQLRTQYITLRAQTDNELSGIGYLPKSISNPFLAPQTQASNLTIDVQARSPYTATHKHKYGPTSPHYTVDKALKRRADKNATPTTARPAKKRKVSAESDYVETESETEKVSIWKATREEDVSSPPEAITCIAAIPLTKKQSQRIKLWTWKRAVGKGKAEIVVESPCGTRVANGW